MSDKTERTIRMVAADVKPGDLVDLEGDRFADPKHDNPTFESELAQVVDVNLETPDCVAIGFEGFDVVGFPVGHLLTVQIEVPAP